MRAEAAIYSPDSFADRVRRRLPSPEEVRDEDGDHLFNPDIADLLRAAALRDAAVLVPVVRRRPEAGVILTERAAHLSSHAGQVAFPGGKIDPEDEDAVAAALREAEEEIGLPPAAVDVLHVGPDYLAGSGYRITPVIGLVDPDLPLAPHEAEVASVFEVPLAFLMDSANHRKGSRIWHGRERHFFEMPFEDRHIWGVTAGIIRVLSQRLYGDAP